MDLKLIDTGNLEDDDDLEYNDLQSSYNDNPKEVPYTSTVKISKVLNENGTMRSVFRAKKTDFVSKMVHLNGKNFDFTGRAYLMPIYNADYKQVLLKTARQVEKSTFLANNLVIQSVVIPYNKSIYVSPSHSQTRQFSNEKLRVAIDDSPLIKRYFQDSFVSQQVFEKSFTNGSFIFMRSAFRTADRVRGLSARNLNLDEIQDLMMSELPVIMECTSHFPDARILMAGTPKSFDNTIEQYWQQTTQNEWVVTCPHCSHHNTLDEKSIAPTEFYVSDKLPPGPVCKKCTKPIDVTKGQWMCFSPGKPIEGFRIPQLMVPWICGLKEQWIKLLWKRDNYPIGQFMNEVLGLSYDNASKPITREELIACCNPKYSWFSDPLTAADIALGRKYQLTAGIDWGEGTDGSERSPNGKVRNASYTVLTIGAYTHAKMFKTVFSKKYVGRETDPEYVIKDIIRICRALEVKLIGTDWGHGWGMNNQLVRTFGSAKVIQFQYLPKMKARRKWDNIGYRFQLNRNLIISELFYYLKKGYIEFPAWKIFEPYAKDILGVFVEYVEFQRMMRYDHRQSDPDDFLHSLLYAKEASEIYLNKRPLN